MEVSVLRNAVRNADRFSDKAWADQLEDRKRDEIDFHDDRDDRQEHLHAVSDNEEEVGAENKKYYQYTDTSRKYLTNWVKQHAAGKVVLDYACGNGATSIEAAKSGAELAVGIDISGVSVADARAWAKRQGVDANTEFVQGDCEKTGFPDNSFDIIICAGMLHHLDLSKSFPELERVLKPGGKLIAYEALNYNPLIKLYRYLTPHLRTAWEREHILSLKDVSYAKQYFNVGEIRFWHMMSILSPHFPALAGVFEKVDNVLCAIPGLRLMSWIFTFELLSKKK